MIGMGLFDRYATVMHVQSSASTAAPREGGLPLSSDTFETRPSFLLREHRDHFD